MITYVILGATYAFAAAAQPGPCQAFLLSRAVSHGWRRTLPAALAPLHSDGPIAVLALVVLTRLPSGFEPALRCAGGVFLTYLAWDSFGTWRKSRWNGTGEPGSTTKTLLSAAMVNLLNPNPYIGWSLVLGPLLLKGWRETPKNGLALVLGFYVTMILVTAGIIVLFAAARNLGPRIRRALVGASAIALLGFACYELWTGTRSLLLG